MVEGGCETFLVRPSEVFATVPVGEGSVHTVAASDEWVAVLPDRGGQFLVVSGGNSRWIGRGSPGVLRVRANERPVTLTFCSAR